MDVQTRRAPEVPGWDGLDQAGGRHGDRCRLAAVDPRVNVPARLLQDLLPEVASLRLPDPRRRLFLGDGDGGGTVEGWRNPAVRPEGSRGLQGDDVKCRGLVAGDIARDDADVAT